MNRRDLIRLGLFAAALLGSRSLQAQQQAQRVRLIDVHCHTFNLSDLPAEDFAEKVMVNEQLERLRKSVPWLANIIQPEKVQVVLRVVANEIRLNAAKPRYELNLLNKSEVRRDTEERKKAELNTLKRLVAHIWSPAVIHKRLAEIDGRRVDRAIIDTAVWQLKYSLRRALGRNTEVAPHEEYPNEPNDIAEGIYYSNEPVGVLARWICGFSVRRSELVDQLHSLLGGDESVILMAPALVDFSMWLVPVSRLVRGQKERPVSPISEQVEVMSRITQRYKAKKGPRVHGYVAFDPLYAAMKTKYPTQFEEDPKKVAMRAIDDQGFLGIKVYPPMGFLPIGNSALKQKGSYPEHVENPKWGLGGDAGKRLDAELTAMYRWCALEGVPILTHANQSNGSEKRFEPRANPKHWLKVFETKDFANLRVCFGHFGGFEESFGDPKVNPGQTWEWQFARLIQHAGAYADISYLEEILPVYMPQNNPQADALRQLRDQHVRRLFEVFLKEFDKDAISKRLMFGSDWYMIGADDGFPTEELYKSPDKALPVLVDKFLEDVGFSPLQRERIMFRNAIEFLGLRKGDPNRRRLDAFYAKHGLDTAWMQALDS